jgi:hypothetical protein
MRKQECCSFLIASLFVLLVALLLGAPAAKADPISVQFNATSTTGLVIQTTMTVVPYTGSDPDKGSGWYTITSISGQVTDPTGNNPQFTTGQIFGIDTVPGGLDITTGYGKFIVDNTMTPRLPVFDDDSGIGFWMGNGPSDPNAAYMNIWANGAAPDSSLSWYQYSPSQGEYQSTTIQPGNYSAVTPEPSTMIIVGSGFVLVCGLLRRRFILT